LCQFNRGCRVQLDFVHIPMPGFRLELSCAWSVSRYAQVFEEGVTMKRKLNYLCIGLLLGSFLGIGEVLAEGTNKLERFHLRRGECHWTPEMGQFIYDCLKRGDGFGAHWCHNGAMDHFCPKVDLDTPVAPAADAAKS
jgi:hypothetical protein